MAVRRLAGSTAFALLTVCASSVQAQVIGTFKWQTLTYCNVVTLTIVQQGGMYQLTGQDDLRVAGVAPATGTAVVAGGGVALGFTVVLPSGAAAHITSAVNAATGNGTWTDADGNGGVFLLAAGPASGGSARPAPASAAVITATQLSPTIYAGTGIAMTIARSDHDHDARYYTQAQTNAAVATAAAVAFEGPGIFVPPTLVVQYNHGLVAETVNTPKAGRLMIAKSFNGGTACSSGTSHYHFLTVDGVPLRSSARYVEANVEFAQSLIGVTAGVISAGAHTISVGSQCLSGTTSGSITTGVSTTSVVVLP